MKRVTALGLNEGNSSGHYGSCLDFCYLLTALEDTALS